MQPGNPQTGNPQTGNPLPPGEASANQDPTIEMAQPRSLRMGLYLLPAFIVLVFIAGWMFVFWLLHEDQDPHSLVQGMQQPGRQSWQRAYALSRLLSDPDNDHLKDDVQLCQALDATLIQLNTQALEDRDAGKPNDEELTQFRAFLCRALGEFRLLDGLPTLLECAAIETSRSSAGSSEQIVKRAAIEAIAVLADNVGAMRIESDSNAVQILIAAINSRSTHLSRNDSDTASAATFALGVLAGPRATEQLVRLLGDTRPDVRYNAATGLARQGRPEAVSVLLEMLDPENRAAHENEKTESARVRKQQMVVSNGIRASMRLLPSVTPQDCKQLVAAVQTLRDSESVPARVRVDAKEALLRLDDEVKNRIAQ